MDEATAALCQQAANGNPLAHEFLTSALFIADFFDAVVDGDEEMPRERVETAMWLSLAGLPRNEFYRQHFADLNPVLMTAMHNWSVATDFERQEGGEYEKTIAYVIRSSYADLFAMVATITGGVPLGRQICKQARLLVHDEGFPEYLEALKREEQARGS